MVVRIGQKSARPRRVYFREWREYRGLTQEQLADRLDTGKSAVSKVEKGVTKYNQSSLEAWAAALNCEPSDLISRPPPLRDDPSIVAVNKLVEDAPADVLRIIETILKTGTRR